MRILISTLFIIHLLTGPALALVFFDQFEYEQTFSLEQGYDDNLTSAKDNKLSDFYTDLGVGLDMRSQQRTHEIVFSGRLTQQVFAQENDLNNLRQDYSVRLNKELSRYDRFSVSNTFSRAEDTDVFEAQFGRINDRYVYDQNRFSFEYSRDFSKQLSFALNYQNDYYNPDREDLSKSTLNAGGIKADYFYSSATIATFVYQIAQRAFDPGDSAVSHTVLAGIRQYLTSQVYLEGQAGVDFISNFNDDNLTEPRFSVSLVDELDDKTQIGVTFSKDYQTNDYTEDIFDSWRVSLTLGRQILERMTVYGSAFFGQGEYASLNIKDDLLGGSLGLRYQLSRDITANFGYSYSQTSSNVDAREYDRNRVLVGIDVKF